MRISKEQLFIIVLGGIVLSSVFLSFTMTGSSILDKIFRWDERRKSDITVIKKEIEIYTKQYGRLPSSLAMLPDRIPKDPGTGDPYRYEISSDKSYRLCAKFSKKNVLGAQTNPLLALVLPSQSGIASPALRMPPNFLYDDDGYQCELFSVAFILTPTPYPERFNGPTPWQ